MKIGLVDVDGHNGFPNLALMKLSAWHKSQGDSVEWGDPMFGRYDRVYMSKVFSFTDDNYDFWGDAEIVKGGTGYGDYTTSLTYEQEHICPDYSLYPNFPHALGFLTRGCCNKCPWCVVPKKEGAICKHADIEEFLDGRKSAVCIDNNVLASEWGLEQIDKIGRMKIRVDFNQAMDARKVTPEVARLLAKTKWINNYMRFAADTPNMVKVCIDAMDKVLKEGYTGGFMIYTMLHGDINECLERIYNLLAFNRKVCCHSQPMLDLTGKTKPPQWQRDMAKWCNVHNLPRAVRFEDFEIRKGFKCGEHLKSIY